LLLKVSFGATTLAADFPNDKSVSNRVKVGKQMYLELCRSKRNQLVEHLPQQHHGAAGKLKQPDQRADRKHSGQ
jgi:hypothetical protein